LIKHSLFVQHIRIPSIMMTSSVAALQAEDDADGLVAMERQHLLQLKKSLETEMGLIQQQLKVSC